MIAFPINVVNTAGFAFATDAYPVRSAYPVPECIGAPHRSGAVDSLSSEGNGECGSCTGGKVNTLQNRAAKEAEGQPPLRCVFMGTPDFAAIILEQLLRSPHVSMQAVFTQPDRPAGRGNKLLPPSVKRLAREHNLPVLQPENFRSGNDGEHAFQALNDVKPDILVVAAYGLILPQRVLDVPRLMPVNVHASLLPKYRGAAPIQRAVMAGDSVTGVTIMRMEATLDTGPILMQRAVGIDINDTSATLHDELAREGADLLILALERLRAGALCAVTQDDELATYADKLTKKESELDFSLSPITMHARIRGLTTWPGASMYLHRKEHEPLLVQTAPGRYPLTHAMKDMADSFLSSRVTHNPEKGAILGVVEKALLLTCGDGCYAFTSLRPAGKKSMDGLAFYNGYLAGTKGAYFTGAEF